MNTSPQQLRAAKAAELCFEYILRPVIFFLAVMSSKVGFFVHGVGTYYGRTALFGDGVSPSSMMAQDLPQSQVTYYDKSFIESLRAETPWIRTTSRRVLPANSGNKHMLFLYNNLGPNTQQAAEGTVGQGIRASVMNNTSTIGQWADFLNVSDMALQTTIDPALENLSNLMSYRLAQTLNSIIQAIADGAINIDSSVNAHSKNATTPMANTDITTNVQSLVGRNVKPFDQGYFTGVVHPFIVGDSVNDNSNNGLVDVLKRTAEGQSKLTELPAPDGDVVQVLEWGGARFHQSTLVQQTPNYLGSGKTALRTYIIGKDGVITISLGATDNTDISDGQERNLKMWMRRMTEPSGYDPQRLIGGFVSYNVKMTGTLPPDPVQRIRIIDAVPIVS